MAYSVAGSGKTLIAVPDMVALRLQLGLCHSGTEDPLPASVAQHSDKQCICSHRWILWRVTQ